MFFKHNIGHSNSNFFFSFSQVDLDGGLSVIRQWIFFGSVTHEKQKIKMLQHDF